MDFLSPAVRTKLAALLLNGGNGGGASAPKSAGMPSVGGFVPPANPSPDQPPPAYTQPFAGPHNAPYGLPQYQTPPFNPNGGATSYMPPMNLPNPNPVNPQTMPSVSSIDRQVAQANPPPPVPQVPPPQASTMPASQPGMMGMNGDVPIGMEMQGMQSQQQLLDQWRKMMDLQQWARQGG